MQSKADNLCCTSEDANASDTLFLSSLSIHYNLYSLIVVSANGIKISSANGHYARKCFTETELSHGWDGHKKLLVEMSRIRMRI